jgi:hypothetical protein
LRLILIKQFSLEVTKSASAGILAYLITGERIATAQAAYIVD